MASIRTLITLPAEDKHRKKIIGDRYEIMNCMFGDRMVSKWYATQSSH